jgi:nicotinate phosphoribosyltransferase
VQPAPGFDAMRAHAKRELERLPEPLRRLEPGVTYPVTVAGALKDLAAEADAQARR